MKKKKTTDPVVEAAKNTAPKTKKKKPESIPRLTVDLLNIREYTGDHFVMRDGSIMDVFQLLGRSLLTADEGDIQQQIRKICVG